jgi:general secretion pathway protein D
MRCLAAGFCVLLAAGCFAAESPAPATPAPIAPAICSDSGGAPVCPGSKKDLKEARKAFARGLKLERSKNLDEALYEFEEASRLIPQNIEYITAQEVTKQHLAGIHLQRGNDDLFGGRQLEALAEFRNALELDPQNEFAKQRINDALGPAPVRAPTPPRVIDSADAIVARPDEAKHDIHYTGDSRGLLTAVASSYGMTVIFDDSFPSKHVRFSLDDADFATALQIASAATKSFSTAIEDKVLYASADSPENHRLYDRMGMRTFYIPGTSSSQDLNEVLNSLRTLFEFKFASMNVASSTVTVRGPKTMLEAATQFLGQLDGERPEVMIDLTVFEVDHTYMRNIGLHVPDNFNLMNIPAAALAALGGGTNIQQLINQLIASGGINQAGNSTIAALLQQLQSQQGSIFSQPLATFGGGLTFFGLSLDQLSAALTMNESSVRQIQHVQLRASQEKDATFKLGSRYPVMNASFAPIYNNSAIASVVGNQSYTAPFPSVNYEDIGLTLKAKPTVHNNSDVALELEVEMRALGAAGSNGIPIITNRSYKGGILLKEGEKAAIAGMLTQSDSKSIAGLPMFSEIPGFGLLTSQQEKQEEDDELLILLTPYVVRSAERAEAPEIWLGK